MSQPLVCKSPPVDTSFNESKRSPIVLMASALASLQGTARDCEGGNELSEKLDSAERKSTTTPSKHGGHYVYKQCNDNMTICIRLHCPSLKFDLTVCMAQLLSHVELCMRPSSEQPPKHRNIFTLRSTDQGTFFPMPIDTCTTGHKKINHTKITSPIFLSFDPLISNQAHQ